MNKKAIRVTAFLICLCLLAGGCDNAAAQNREDTSDGAYFDLSELDSKDREDAALKGTQYLAHFGGYVGARVDANLKNWLYDAYESNPLMLDSVRQNGETDIAGQVDFWFGMFTPCLLRGAAGCYEMERDPVLYEKMERIVADALACLDEYGSLEYDAEGEEFPLINPSWLNGAIEWYMSSSSPAALELSIRLGDYYIEQAETRGINDTMPIGGIAQLYLETGEARFYQLLEKYILAWGWTGGDYKNAAENGVEYCETLRNNWENVFEVAALGPIGEALGDSGYEDALQYMVESIILTDRRSTGANTTAEGAVGSPYEAGSAETCGNVSWAYLLAEAAGRAKRSDLIDELELTFWNAVLGAQDMAGRWWTYDTPQEGYRVASIQELNWQAVQGAPEFSCCMSNAALGIGTLSDWALTRDDTGIYVNYFGESEMVAATPAGNLIRLTQRTGYPADGTVRLTLEPEEAEAFSLNIRVPIWSENTQISVNGKRLEKPLAGGYYKITKTWESGDTVELSLDMSPHYWAAEKTHLGQISVYRGPVLLALDSRFEPEWDGRAQALDLESFSPELTVSEEGYPSPAVLLKARNAAGETVTLCDFATAGQSGTRYTTWFDNSQLVPPRLARGACCWNQRFDSEKGE